MTTRTWFRRTIALEWDNNTPPTSTGYSFTAFEDDTAASPETTIVRQFLDMSMTFVVLNSSLNYLPFDFPLSLNWPIATGVRNDGDQNYLDFTSGTPDPRVTGTGTMEYITQLPSIDSTSTLYLYRTTATLETQGQRKSTSPTLRPRPLCAWTPNSDDFSLREIPAWFIKLNVNWRVLHQDPS